ncbi:MAG: ABC transporter permease [Chloroflexi bacterium]|nr:ABC transporter permease [Chloroflexota bacterium]MCY4246177.1 ABC transporter permease [Chloroflexota bacterium]
MQSRQQLDALPARLWRKWLRVLAPLATILLLIGLWQLIASLELISPILLPPPAAVAGALSKSLADGSLLKHAATTLEEMLAGLCIGVAFGLTLGYAIAKAPLLESLLSPLIVAFQSTPIVAYAPLLVIWFGTGVTGKIVTTAIIVFFPTLVNTIAGIRGLESRLRDLFRSLRASRWQTFRHLELPAALPVILAGLKTSSTLAVIGAVVGEFVSARYGLGALVIAARSRYDTPMVIVSALTMTALALALYSLVAYIEWRVMAWRRQSTA